MCSHSMYHVQKLCRHALWLKDGRVERYGAAADVTQAYLAYHEEKRAAIRRPPQPTRRPPPPATIASVRSSSSPAKSAPEGATLVVRGDSPLAGRPRAGRADRHRARRRHAGVRRGHRHGRRRAARVAPRSLRVRPRVSALPLLPGKYFIRAHALDPEGVRMFDTRREDRSSSPASARARPRAARAPLARGRHRASARGSGRHARPGRLERRAGFAAMSLTIEEVDDATALAGDLFRARLRSRSRLSASFRRVASHGRRAIRLSRATFTTPRGRTRAGSAAACASMRVPMRVPLPPTRPNGNAQAASAKSSCATRSRGSPTATRSSVTAATRVSGSTISTSGSCRPGRRGCSCTGTRPCRRRSRRGSSRASRRSGRSRPAFHARARAHLSFRQPRRQRLRDQRSRRSRRRISRSCAPFRFPSCRSTRSSTRACRAPAAIFRSASRPLRSTTDWTSILRTSSILFTGGSRRCAPCWSDTSVRTACGCMRRRSSSPRRRRAGRSPNARCWIISGSAITGGRRRSPEAASASAITAGIT